MLKLIGMLLVLSLIVGADIVVINTQGVYTHDNKPLEENMAKITKEVRAKALLDAQNLATQEAGTTIFSRFTSTYDMDKDRYKYKNDLDAISSALVKYKVIREGWKENVYFVNIEAEVDVADAEKIFREADERLKKIARLQKDNVHIVRQLRRVAEEILKLRRNKYTKNDLLEIEKLDIKIQKKELKEQELMYDYEDNIAIMKVTFKKGTLMDIAKNTERKFEKAKVLFDQYVINKLKENFIANIRDIDVIINGDTADISFILGLKVKKYIKIEYPLAEWMLGMHYGAYAEPRGKAMNSFKFIEHANTYKLENWAENKRSLYARIKIGDEYFIAEKVAYYFNGKYYVLGNEQYYYAEKMLRDIPVSQLDKIESISVDLVIDETTESQRRDRALLMKRKGKVVSSFVHKREATELY